MIGLRTLVLNPDMTPISLFPLEAIPVEDGFKRVWNETCFAVAQYERPILQRGRPSGYFWPSVVARKQYVSWVKWDEDAQFTKTSIYFRDHGKCTYCGQHVILSNASFDHVVPRSKGGKSTWENLVLACKRCNLFKGDSAPTGEWVPKHNGWKPSQKSMIDMRRKFAITVDHESWIPYLGKWEGPINVRSSRFQSDT